jgi:hypothetical protein
MGGGLTHLWMWILRSEPNGQTITTACHPTMAESPIPWRKRKSIYHIVTKVISTSLVISLEPTQTIIRIQFPQVAPLDPSAPSTLHDPIQSPNLPSYKVHPEYTWSTLISLSVTQTQNEADSPLSTSAFCWMLWFCCQQFQISAELLCIHS